MLGSRPVSRRGLSGAATASLAVAAAVFPAVGAARVVEPVTVSKSVSVPAGQTRTLDVRCPARAVALNGSVRGPLAGTESIPRNDARHWTFRVTAGTRARSTGVDLRCVRLRLPHRVDGVGVSVGTQIEPIFEIPAGNTQQIALKCNRGEVPTGWGLGRRSPDNALELAGVVPTDHGWLFTVANPGPVGAAGTIYARCLQRKQRAASGQHHFFSTRVAAFSQPIDGGGTTSRSCRRRELSVSTGVSLPAGGGIRMTATSLFGSRGGEWSFAQPFGAASIKTSLICLARSTGFHR
jgi:hypothetical protein